MKLTELLSKRLILLSGKGGVGKTTVAVLLALAAVEQKKNVLLVEMDSTERIGPYFGISSLGQDETPLLSPFLTGINLKPEKCFEEYVLMQIHFKTIYDIFMRNRFVTAFIDGVPGLHELLMVGKIYDLERQKKKKSDDPLYDLIIVDGPATGHGISIFEVPEIVCKAVKGGPLKNQAERIVTLLKDTKKTAFSVVTLAEEMPVTEADEMLASVREKLHIALGPIFLNNFHFTSFTDEEGKKIEKKLPENDDPLYPYFAYSSLAFERFKLNKYYGNELQKENPKMDVITLPHLYSEIKKYGDLKPLIEDLLKNT